MHAKWVLAAAILLHISATNAGVKTNSHSLCVSIISANSNYWNVMLIRITSLIIVDYLTVIKLGFSQVMFK